MVSLQINSAKAAFEKNGIDTKDFLQFDGGSNCDYVDRDCWWYGLDVICSRIKLQEHFVKKNRDCHFYIIPLSSCISVFEIKILCFYLKTVLKIKCELIFVSWKTSIYISLLDLEHSEESSRHVMDSALRLLIGLAMMVAQAQAGCQEVTTKKDFDPSKVSNCKGGLHL